MKYELFLIVIIKFVNSYKLFMKDNIFYFLFFVIVEYFLVS